MESLPFYIISSKPTSWILRPACYLFQKYWSLPQSQNFTILGEGQINDLPANFKFVSIKQGNNIQTWTSEIAKYIRDHETSEYFMFALDDYLPNDFLKSEILQNLLAYAKESKKVGRIALGKLDVEKWDSVKDLGSYKIVKLKNDSPYRLSCQISVWHREYFLKYFSNNWTPWQLELEGSKQARQDGWEIIGTDGDWAFSWQEESALSGRWPNMVNILGLRPEDIKYCIERGWFKPETLQYGIWYDCKLPFLSRFQSLSKQLTKIPKFSEVGYDFRWRQIKWHVRSKTLKRLLFRYKNLYKD